VESLAQVKRPPQSGSPIVGQLLTKASHNNSSLTLPGSYGYQESDAPGSRHRSGGPEELRQRGERGEEGTTAGGNTGRSPRGNPAERAERRIGVSRKCGKPRKGRQARKSQAALPAGKTLEGSNAHASAGVSEAQERIGVLGRPAGRKREDPKEEKPRRVACAALKASGTAAHREQGPEAEEEVEALSRKSRPGDHAEVLGCSSEWTMRQRPTKDNRTRAKRPERASAR
jgi:hypothetical protein